MQIKQRMVTINLHIMNTCFGEAKSEVQNKQPLEPHERLAAIWSALESRYGDIPEQVILDSKQRLEQLMVFKVKDHPDGTATFRKFDTRSDTVDAFFQRLEMVRVRHLIQTNPLYRALALQNRVIPLKIRLCTQPLIRLRHSSPRPNCPQNNPHVCGSDVLHTSLPRT